MGDFPRGLKHATVWLLLALSMFLAVQAYLAHQQATRFVVDGAAIVIRRSPDGHYYWPGRIGDAPVEFLVDTGASGTAIPTALARELGLPVAGSVRSQTAGGIASGVVVVGDPSLRGGLRADRLRIAALPGLASPLLGMDVLGRLHLRQDEGELRIDLRPAVPR